MAHHGHVKTLRGGKPENSADYRSRSLPPRDRVGCGKMLKDIPEELLLVIAQFLGHGEQFRLCLASSRVIPHTWGVVLVCYAQALKNIQHKCESQGILTEIASDAQIDAQEKWWQCIQQRKMLMEDVRAFDENAARFELDLQDIITQERDKLNRFQATVEVLGDVMKIWSRCCTQRDQIAQMCQKFHLCVSKVFAIQVSSKIAPAESQTCVAAASAFLENNNKSLVEAPATFLSSESENFEDVGIKQEEQEESLISSEAPLVCQQLLPEEEF